MLYNVIKRMIERNQTDGLREKLDVFFAVGSLTQNEYSELASLLESREG